MYNVRHLASADRADLAALLRALTPEQWQTPSLCAGWTVRDVVTHMLSYEELDPLGVARRFGRTWLAFDRASALGLGFDRANDFGLAAYADHDPPALLALLDRSTQPRGLTDRFGGRTALLDGMIHQQDIRRPLGISRTIPVERLVPALTFARIALPLRSPWRVRGLRLVATDFDWHAGRGPEVRGSGESLLMAMAGRHGITRELDGPGQATLAARIEG